MEKAVKTNAKVTISSLLCQACGLLFCLISAFSGKDADTPHFFQREGEFFSKIAIKSFPLMLAKPSGGTLIQYDNFIHSSYLRS
jgi:hypothetical protein